MLGDDCIYRFTVVDRQSLTAWNFEFVRIEAELFKNCGMNISDVVSVFYGMEAKFVSCTVHKPAFDTTASHPD